MSKSPARQGYMSITATLEPQQRRVLRCTAQQIFRPERCEAIPANAVAVQGAFDGRTAFSVGEVVEVEVWNTTHTRQRISVDVSGTVPHVPGTAFNPCVGKARLT